MSWIKNVLLGIDQLANTIVGGMPDETLSSRSARNMRALRAFLNILEKDHSYKSLEYTPWGTADSHDLYPVHEEIAMDWNALIAILESERDLDAFPEATKQAAARAQERLRVWDRRDRWLRRMERDMDVGDRFQR